MRTGRQRRTWGTQLRKGNRPGTRLMVTMPIIFLLVTTMEERMMMWQHWDVQCSKYFG